MDIPNKHEKSTKNQSITEWYIYGKCRAMGKNVESLYCHQVEAVEYIELLSMRYNDTNLVTQRVFFFFQLGFTPCKAKQPLRRMELQERKHKKDYRIQKIFLERTYS